MRQRIIILQHGSHGTHYDFTYLARYLKSLENPPIIWESNVNEGFRTDDGIIICGERFANDIINKFHNLCLPVTSKLNNIVQMSFISHSMGGLIVREALPKIFREIQRTHTKENINEKKEKDIKVEWKLFCSIATPHAGTCQMDAFIRSYLGRLLGKIYSTAYHDMFLQSNIITEHLLSPEHLMCFEQFQQRLLISSVNDLLVPLISSGFILKPTEKGINKDILHENESIMCAFNEEDMMMGIKRQRITKLNNNEWPIEKYPVERNIVKTLLENVGAFDSIVVDFRSIRECHNDKLVKRGAYELSHRALICKPPLHLREEQFGFVSKFIAHEVMSD